VNPLNEIRGARADARAAADPLVDVCYLVTLRADGFPDARALSLRAVSDDGLGILINATSPKWREMLEHPQIGLLIHWPTIRRQFRILGTQQPMDPAEVAALWAKKQRTSALLDTSYATQPQSSEIPSHADFVERIRALDAETPDPVPIPESLRGCVVVPHQVEVWRGSPDRLHDRELFVRDEGDWTAVTIAP
jgi:pyridoxamine 5'-phosphate oxidase